MAGSCSMGWQTSVWLPGLPLSGRPRPCRRRCRCAIVLPQCSMGAPAAISAAWHMAYPLPAEDPDRRSSKTHVLWCGSQRVPCAVCLSVPPIKDVFQLSRGTPNTKLQKKNRRTPTWLVGWLVPRRPKKYRGWGWVSCGQKKIRDFFIVFLNYPLPSPRNAQKRD
jgi:hypothetical protein